MLFNHNLTLNVISLRIPEDIETWGGGGGGGGEGGGGRV